MQLHLEVVEGNFPLDTKDEIVIFVPFQVGTPEKTNTEEVVFVRCLRGCRKGHNFCKPFVNTVEKADCFPLKVWHHHCKSPVWAKEFL